MWFVYVLLCHHDTLYTGISTDVQKRFQTHLAGKGGHYTRAHPPVKVLYQEAVPTKSDALKRELEIKSWTRQQKIARLKLLLHTS